MAFNQVQLCNMALTHVKVSRFIQSLDENSIEAGVCKLWYDPALEQILEDADWQFATRYVALSLVEGNPNGEWQYAYRYPPDCVKARAIVRASIGRKDDEPPPFVIASDDSGRLILTDEKDAVLRYTRRITDTGMFSASFANAFACLLASKIANPLSKSDMYKQVFQMYLDELSVAAAFNKNETRQDEAFEAEWIRDR